MTDAEAPTPLPGSWSPSNAIPRPSGPPDTIDGKKKGVSVETPLRMMGGRLGYQRTSSLIAQKAPSAPMAPLLP